MKRKLTLYRNYLHFFKHALWRRLYPEHRVPLTVTIALTKKCPNRCLYCTYADIQRPDRLTGENLQPVLEEAYRAGTRRIHFTGGEPTLHPDFDELVLMAAKRGFIVSVATCGHHAGEHIESFCQCNAVLLSLDGPPEVQAQQCGEISAVEAFRAADLFQREGVKFWTTTVLTRLNLDSIDWVVDYARLHGTVANFSLLESTATIGCDYHPSPEQIKPLLPSNRDYRGAVAHLIELKEAAASVGSSLPYLKSLLAWPDYRHFWSPEPWQGYSCLAGMVSCEIGVDGSMYACDSLMGQKLSSPVLELGFAEAFRRLPLSRSCQSCLSDCYIEGNLLFNLNIKAIWNWTRNL